MPRKQFVSDFQAAQNQLLHPSISDLCKGDEDGMFTFLYSSGDGQIPVQIEAIIPELSEYPSSHQYFLCTPDGCSSTITDGVACVDTDGVRVADLLKKVGQMLDKVVMGKKERFSDDLDEEMTYSDDDQAYDDAEAEEEEEEYDDDDVVSVGGWSDASAPDTGLDAEGDSQMDRDTGTPDSERWRAFCHDLRAVKRAGFKVGMLGHLPTLKGFISVSIKISKLGISEEAMTAWRTDPNRYLVLLLYFPGKYKGLGSYLNHSFSDRKPSQFCVGICDRYKPTYEEAIDAFTKARKQPTELEEEGYHSRNASIDNTNQPRLQEEKEDKGTSFEGLFISTPLNQLMNDRFYMLLKYRMSFGLEWDGAERFYNDFQGLERISEQIADVYYSKEETARNLSALCKEDELQTSSKEALSLPLIAMQFMLRHFVRCTEFCLVCHAKVENNFEALKPYVCSKPLCLYQYMALGFGPSMEYEILSQPSVVDLLISFCYISAANHKLRDFPTGLNLKVLPAAVTPHLGVYNIETQQITVTMTSDETKNLRVGEWITMTAQGITTDQSHCRVIEVDYYPKIKVALPVGHKASINVFNPESRPPGSSDNIPIQFNIYSENFDRIEDEAKRTAIVHILETLPSVNEMRTWLLKNKKVGEQASLVQWKNRISPTACNLLRWIIASNRSCILQIDETPDDSLTLSDPLAQAPLDTRIEPKGCVTGEERVWGMNGWVQFRFAMGAPDKEQRFVNEVAKVTSSKSFPTLFAWHGSPLHNWHSIIREGLHFKDTAHGRAFGHGCYHSLDLNTSLGYSGRGYYYNSGTASSFWPKSHLKIDSALCLNEIINAPDQFVSKSPHLVVAQLDWIQTRYLFVKTGNVYNSNNNTDSGPKPDNFIPQDPTYTPRNAASTHLIIPEAVSASRSRQSGNKKAKASASKASASKESKFGRSLRKIGKIGSAIGDTLGVRTDAEYGYQTDETDDEDVAILFHDDDIQSGKGKEVSKPKKVDPDAFVPGSLDMKDIELLPPPTYATPIATKRLQNELKSMLKLQSQQDISELGWYINGDMIENVYHWIIEMHSFDKNLPLAQDMKKAGIKSIVMEARFGKDFPMTPPFIRIIKPRFTPFLQGGGGHVTAGGALCMELLTNTGWSAVSSMEAVLLQIRMALMSTDPKPAKLELRSGWNTYSPQEAREAYLRAARSHSWAVPPDFHTTI